MGWSYYEEHPIIPQVALDSAPTEEGSALWVLAESPARRQWRRLPDPGKWLIFVEPARVDAIWENIKKETERGALGVSAKASTAASYRGGDYVICVYTPDAQDETEVRRVRALLFDLGWHGDLCYKTDAMTRQGTSGSLYRY